MAGITIAGEPVLIEWQGQLNTFLRDRLPAEDILFCRHPVQPLSANPLVCDNANDYCESPYPPLPPIQIGEFQWPSGASRYARALYAVDWPTMRAVAESAWGWQPPTELIAPEGDPDDIDNQREVALTDVPESWGTEFYEVTLSIPGEETLSVQMYPLRPYRITGNGIDCWLLPLVDKRWKMAHKAFVPLETKPETMAELIEELATAAGATITVKPRSITGSPDPRLWKAEQPAVNLLDVACLSSGLRVVLDPGGELIAMDQATSETNRTGTLSREWKVLSGGTRGKTELPSSLKVYCRKEGSRAPHVETVNVPSGNTVGGTSLAAWSSWLKTDENGTQTTTFAGQVAASVSAWSNSGGQYGLHGVIDYQPSGYDDFFSIILEEKATGEYVLRSTIRELPGVFLPRALLIGGQEDDCCDSEDHFLFTLLEYMAGGGALAEIRTMDNSAQVEASATVKDTLGHFSHLRAEDRGICVRVDDVYYAVHPDDASRRDGGTPTFGHVFTLNGKLDKPHGSTASATVTRSGETGVSNGATITVINTGNKVGYTGAIGWAVKVGLEYWVVELDQYPLQSLVIFDDDTHTFSGAGVRQGKIEDQKTISVSSWQAMTPYPFSFVPAVATIHNPHNLLALSGDSGIVVWNNSYEDVENFIYGRFELVEVFPFTKRRLQFRLTADIDTMLTVAVENFEIIQTREFAAGQVAEPSPKYLYDDMKLIRYGRTGDLGECEYSYREGNWQVTSFRRRGDSILAKTPYGGIPACSGSGPYTFGAADCTVVKPDGTLSAETQSIKNIVNMAIAGSVLIKADPVGDVYVVDVASCGV